MSQIPFGTAVFRIFRQVPQGAGGFEARDQGRPLGFQGSNLFFQGGIASRGHFLKVNFGHQ